MAIIVDPDNVDRDQVIYGTENRLISIYPVGSLVNTSASGSDGYTSGTTTYFSASSATFSTWTVTPGDILSLFSKDDAGHYIINSVESETELLVESSSWDGHNSLSTFTGSNDTYWQVHDPTGGSLADGVTKQALYSYSKEEWRVDSFGSTINDDLIRHEFPYEPITNEQFEIGGGASHEDWSYFNDFTRKKIRTGGWADVNTAGTTLQEWTGIITLGSLDSDTQVYYQQFSASADPTDFDFLGAVNESIPIFYNGSDFNTRTFLKLFARKKTKTYAQSEIADIGVTTIGTIVNRFPLTHADDPAIVATDGAISGSSPFRGTNELSTNTNGVTADVDTNTGTLTSAGSTFITDGVVAGDVLEIVTAGADSGYYTVLSVDSETVLTVDTSELGGFTGLSSLTFTVDTIFIVRPNNNGENNVIVNATGDTGYLSSSGGNFLTAGVAADDLVIILSASSITPSFDREFMGVYKVVSGTGEDRLTLNTEDKQFPTTSGSNVHFAVVEPGMYLQRKEEPTSGSAGLAPGHFDTGNLTFANADPDTITRASGDWGDDGVTSGTIVIIGGTTSNNVTGTVATVDSPTQVTLVATDTLTAEGPVSGTVRAFDPFKRSINNVTYGFRWRLLGNSSTLANCYQFVQHQLRQPTDIDFGSGISLTGLPAIARGDVTDLLMQFASPTATTFDMYIDDLDATDTNNVTFRDATENDRTFAFVSVGTISFNSNLQSDASAVYRMFFTNDDAGDNTGRDYGTPDAIIVQDDTGAEITGSVGGASSVQFTYDYDANVQRGGASAGTDAPVTIVAIGLATAQFVIATTTIERTKTNNVTLVSSLERVYSNP